MISRNIYMKEWPVNFSGNFAGLTDRVWKDFDYVATRFEKSVPPLNSLRYTMGQKRVSAAHDDQVFICS